MRLIASAMLGLILAIPAARAETCGPRLVVDFLEGAPKDRFTLVNASDAGWSLRRAVIDLAGSAGGLYLDVSEDGAGVSVYQPYESLEGGAQVAEHPTPRDGDTALTFVFGAFPPGARFAFTIDVDDSLGRAPTLVSGAEIGGATVRAVFVGPGGALVEKRARFDTESRADTGLVESCVVS